MKHTHFTCIISLDQPPSPRGMCCSAISLLRPRKLRIGDVEQQIAKLPELVNGGGVCVQDLTSPEAVYLTTRQRCIVI